MDNEKTANEWLQELYCYDTDPIKDTEPDDDDSWPF
jgi:hypothetical protein